MSRIRLAADASATTPASNRVDDQSMLIREFAWHAFVSWTGTAPTSVQVSYTPDTPDVIDASAEWFSPTALLFTTQGDTYFQAKPRRFRIVVAGGDGTTAVTVEIR